MLKRNLSKSSVFLIGLAGLASSLTASETVSVGSAVGQPGESIVLPVEIKPENPIVGVQFSIRYAPEHVTCGAPGVGSSDSDHVATSDDNRNGRRAVVVYSPTNDTLPDNFSISLPLALSNTSPAGGPSVLLEGMIFTDAGGGVYTDQTTYARVEEWRRRNFTRAELLSHGVVGDDDDPDGDGIPNLLELAAGTEPTKADEAVPGVVYSTETDETGQAFLKIKFWKASSALDLVEVSAEASEDLLEWSTGSVSQAPTGEANVGGEEIEFRVPIEPEARKRYLRLNATRKLD